MLSLSRRPDAAVSVTLHRPDALPPKLHRAWADAAAAQGAALPYCGPDYVGAVLAAYHADPATRVLAAWRGDTLAGLLPLVARGHRRLGLPLREMGLPRNPNTINSDPLAGPPGPARSEVLAALLRAGFAAGAETLMLDHLPAGLGSAFADAAATLGAGTDPVTPSRHLHYARLDGGWDGYLATRSGNHRWQIRKALKGAGALQVQRLDRRAALRDALDDWFAVEARSWQGTAGAGAAMTAADRGFHRSLVETLPDAALGELWLVRDATGRALAALRMLAGPRGRSVHTMHFDAAARAAAPGLLAFAAMMRAAAEDALPEVDFHGRTAFFERWATGARAHESLRIYRPGPKGALARHGRLVLRRLVTR
ncbi:GNAT family N-acetyltransferase [Frigidibacter sp. MR17.14]|uniref:GNAT family N-acetyltransferase n=1 Tax=Frigidibacter sp. MR17.14 TaxID=3126509 RepID=UPI0030131C63